jgi:four helix bundle protein
MTIIESHKDLDVYKKSYQLALQIYRMTRRFPTEEKYGLTDQLRRAAVSIPSNIAEGYRRYTHTDYVRFLRIAFGSCGELDTQLDLCRDLDLIESTDHARLSALSSDVSKMLHRLIKSLNETGIGSRASGVGRS